MNTNRIASILISIQSGPGRIGPAPATQEEDGAERRERDRLDELGVREHRVAQAAVLGVEAGDDLAVRLRRGRTAGRFDSASAAMKKTTKPMICGPMYQ